MTNPHSSSPDTLTHPPYWDEAVAHLKAVCPVMERLISTYGETCGLFSRGDAFYTLARSIVGQQISVKAADSVWARLVTALPALTPQHALAADEATLRACGLSQSKVRYLHHLAEHLHTTPDAPAQWHAASDAEAMRMMTQLKGIGPWTAEMMLIFYLLRADVFPLGDIGLRKGLNVHYNGGQPLSDAEIAKISNRLSPFRTVATWYLWRSLDPVPVEY